MTLRHTVLMKFPDGADAAFIAAMHAAVVDLAAAVPEVLASTSGPDASGKAENCDYALVFDFADAAAYERYRVHPAHQAFIAQFMRGRTIDKARIQLQLE